MLRVGVVGLGYWGPNLVRNFNKTEGAQVAYCCDLSRERRERIHQAYPMVQLTGNYQDLLQSDAVDAVAVATPVSTHHGIVKDALAAGKHVLVEKPIAASVAEAEELAELAGEYDRVLMVDHTFLFHAAVRKLKELTVAGELGDIFYIDSVRVNLGLFQHDVDVLWDLAPHDLSIVAYLLEKQPVSVEANGVGHLSAGTPDVAYLNLRYDDNSFVHVHVSWLSPIKVRRTAIGGTKKMVVYDDMEVVEKIKVYDRGVMREEGREGEYLARFQYRIGDVHAPRILENEALHEECKHFVHCCETGETPVSDGRFGLGIVRILEAAKRSLKLREEGKPSTVFLGEAPSPGEA